MAALAYIENVCAAAVNVMACDTGCVDVAVVSSTKVSAVIFPSDAVVLFAVIEHLVLVQLTSSNCSEYNAKFVLCGSSSKAGQVP